MAKPRKIQIFGERCSGTNYLERLVRNNLPSTEITWGFGWKHFFHKPLEEEQDHCLFLVIYRNPFDWICSLHRKPHHASPELKNIAFSDFIRKEWRCIFNEKSGTAPDDPLFNTEMLFERNPETGQRFANILRLRNAKIRNWESLRDKVNHTHYLQYEDLQRDPKGQMELIADKFNLSCTPTFDGVDSYKGYGKRAFQPLSYDPIAVCDIDYIVNELDCNLELQVGYDLHQLANQRLKMPAHKSGIHPARLNLSTAIQHLYRALR